MPEGLKGINGILKRWEIKNIESINYKKDENSYDVVINNVESAIALFKMTRRKNVWLLKKILFQFKYYNITFKKSNPELIKARHMKIVNEK